MNHHQRDLLERIDRAGIVLKIDGDTLEAYGPENALTAQLQKELLQWKPDLLKEYKENAGILRYDGGRICEDTGA
jgi:hypothetical protein